MHEIKTFEVEIAGMGFIVYSPHATAHIRPDETYLQACYWEPADVARHVCKGTIAGFCTGSPGTYVVRAFLGVPTLLDYELYPSMIALALEVKDRTVCIRDLFSLSRWDPACPAEQTLTMDDGYYHLVVGTGPPESGIVGDEQEIAIFFEPRDTLPPIIWEGVPFLGADDDDGDGET